MTLEKKSYQINDMLLEAKENFNKGSTVNSTQIYKNILQVEPYNFHANQNLAIILNNGGQAAQSVEQAKRSLLGDLSNIPANDIAILGLFFLEHEKYKYSLKCFEKALEKEPDNYSFIYNAAYVANRSDKFKIAINYYLSALEIKREPLVLNQLSEIYYKTSQIDKAFSLTEESLKIKPDTPDALTMMGNLLITMGKLDDAEKNLLRAIDLNNECIDAYLALARIKRLDKKYIQNLERLLQNSSLHPSARTYGYFALGEINNNFKNYDEAFKYYLLGNSIKVTETNFNITPLIQTTKRYISIFTKEFLHKKRAIGHPSKTPIFIVGMPRSGTTLTEQIISCHSKAVGIGEKSYIELIAKKIPPIKPKGSIEELSFPECLPYMKQKDIAIHAVNYFKLIENFDGTKKVVNKLPANFIHLGFISFLFPNATFIHCKRHPLDVCLSIFFQLFIDIEYSYKIKDIADYYKFYHSVMKIWERQMPGRIYNSYYEELLFKQEEKSREIISHCGLKWEEACLEFYKKEGNVHTASKWQVRQKLYSSSMNKWKNYEKFLLPLKEFLSAEIAEYENYINTQTGYIASNNTESDCT
ncbi:MAG: sulfotransferase [Rickettsiales bacterium]|nr:sulfotransferase [Pseudomonadota bacterium]MDA0965872.1 sulfotransferase [Pseudomonadota bacterium]MDG4542658.1 sulfotransferase [Rickettsiales bacterium]MDG4545162.1 sulfotransferase [Rickettsiales bacterium]MDG4547285.1 sulfotransferase [Rickettsiales bacterium]